MPGPLGRIGLSLSGGGYRAAGFHLGTLDLLSRLGCLTDVAVLSTVSGGTLLGCRYALSLARGEDFATFFRRAYRFLFDTNVIAAAVETLSGPDAPERRALITGAARVYMRDDFLGAATLGDLMDAGTHLEEMFFNATEFRTGQAFRFQVGRHRGRIGNRRVSIPRATARLVRLADVAAASSCFPGGFEPFVFPDDFTLPSGFQWKGRPIPLMDGGIYDNQGTAALLLADRRGTAVGRRIDLFVVSDSHPRGELDFEVPRRGRPAIRLGTVAVLARVLLGVAVLSVAALAVEAMRVLDEGTFRPIQVLTLGFPLAFIGGAATAFTLLWRRLRREVRARTPPAARPVLEALRHLGVREAIDLVEVRVRSLVTLTSQVFLGRVRNLGYEKLYARSDYEGRRVSNLIYDLADATPRATRLGLAPTPAQRDVTARAGATPTTLWFDDDTRLRDLVACGHNTACFNLLEQLQVTPPRDADPEATRALVERARALWEALGREPWHLVDERLRG